MAGSVQVFRASETIALSVSTTAAAGAFTVADGDSILIFNATSDFIFVGLGGAVATNSGVAMGTPVPAGARQLFQAPASVKQVSVLNNSTTGTVFASLGYGTAY